MRYILLLLICLLGCATTRKEIGTLCHGFGIEFHSKESYPTIPMSTLNAMMRTCRVHYNGCLARAIQSTKYPNSWYAICRRDVDAQRP